MTKILMTNMKIKIRKHITVMKKIINKTEEEEALIERLKSMNLPLKVVNDLIGTISSFGKKMIELEGETSKDKWENRFYSTFSSVRGKSSSTFIAYIQKIGFIFIHEKKLLINLKLVI